jgi:hypothetical protein
MVWQYKATITGRTAAVLNIVWPFATQKDLPSFRSNTEMEKYNGTPVGSSIDPQLNAPGAGGSINNSDSDALNMFHSLFS